MKPKEDLKIVCFWLDEGKTISLHFKSFSRNRNTIGVPIRTQHSFPSRPRVTTSWHWARNEFPHLGIIKTQWKMKTGKYCARCAFHFSSHFRCFGWTIQNKMSYENILMFFYAGLRGTYDNIPISGEGGSEFPSGMWVRMSACRWLTGLGRTFT